MHCTERGIILATGILFIVSKQALDVCNQNTCVCNQSWSKSVHLHNKNGMLLFFPLTLFLFLGHYGFLHWSKLALCCLSSETRWHRAVQNYQTELLKVQVILHHQSQLSNLLAYWLSLFHYVFSWWLWVHWWPMVFGEAGFLLSSGSSGTSRALY